MFNQIAIKIEFFFYIFALLCLRLNILFICDRDITYRKYNIIKKINLIKPYNGHAIFTEIALYRFIFLWYIFIALPYNDLWRDWVYCVTLILQIVRRLRTRISVKFIMIKTCFFHIVKKKKCLYFVPWNSLLSRL